MNAAALQAFAPAALEGSTASGRALRQRPLSTTLTNDTQGSSRTIHFRISGGGSSFSVLLGRAEVGGMNIAGSQYDEGVNSSSTWTIPSEAEQKLPHVNRGHIGQGFDAHFAKLEAIVADPSLWPEGAEGPSEGAAAWASAMLDQLGRDQLVPTRVVASAEGGVAICFVRGDKYADIEILNTGEILGVISNRRDRPVVWEVNQTLADMARASTRVRDFIDTSSPVADDPSRSRP